jgi:two-component system CheB/CheR fusion protein
LGRPHHQATPIRWYQYEIKYLEKTASVGGHSAINGVPLADELNLLVRAAIAQARGQARGNVRAAFYAADGRKTALHHVTGMTKEYARCVDGFAISPRSLACGLAAATRRAVITPDVMQEPSWSRWQWLAKDFDYRACWSFPIETTNGKLVGTFAIYLREPAEAKQGDLDFVSELTRAAARIMSDAFTG